MNMSYCAFENTYRDLRQCLDLLEEGGPDSKDEIVAARQLVELCGEIHRDFLDHVTEKETVLKSKKAKK